MKSSYGYSAYRGRSSGRRFLTVLAVLLTLVLIAAIAAFFLLQGHIYYGDDGKAHVELPGWGQSAEQPGPSQDAITVVTHAPEETVPALASLPVLDLVTDGGNWGYDGAAALAAAEGSAVSGGVCGAVLDMKGADGMLAYVSDLPVTIRMGTSDATPGRNEAIRALTGTEGLYTVARIACFRDDRAPYYRNDMALRSYAGNWRDTAQTRWLNVAIPDTQAYLAGVCTELAGLGFDEIWLDWAGYPAAGNLDNIVPGEYYDPEDLTTPVADFYAAVRGALANYPNVKVGITTSAAVARGETDPSGQTLEALKRYADRLYLPAPANDAEAAAFAEAVADMAPPVFLSGGEGELSVKGGRVLNTP